jgi:hypothetical protein
MNAMQCNAMQCNAMQCNAMQCDAMQCNAMQCNAMQAFPEELVSLERASKIPQRNFEESCGGLRNKMDFMRSMIEKKPPEWKAILGDWVEEKTPRLEEVLKLQDQVLAQCVILVVRAVHPLPTHSLAHFAHSLNRFLTRSLTHSCTHSLAPSLAGLLAR